MLASAAVTDGNGPIRVTYKPTIRAKTVWAILAPYVRDKFLEQLKALAPITLALLVFQFAVFRLMHLEHPLAIAAGMCCVIVGLMFFIAGLRVGVMPLGENIGSTMPAKARLWVIFLAACILGTMANMAEPAIGALRILGSKISPRQAPLLFDYLNVRTDLVVWILSIGVGLGACNGIYRFVRGWSLKVTIIPGLLAVFVLTILAATDPNASSLLGVAWDAGGITTGTVTAPLLLALGVGLAAALGKNRDGMAGFGIITLCSIWPIALFLGMGLYHSWTGNFMSAAEGEAFLAHRTAAAAAATGDINVPAAIGQNLVSAATAILPLMFILLFLQRVVLKEPIRNLERVVVGIGFALVGLLLFKLGLEWGLSPLGEQVGRNSAVSFSGKGFEDLAAGIGLGGRYGALWGKLVVLAFGFVVGYGASLAEPALTALGMTVEDVTSGAFKRKLVMHTVAFGVGVGLVIGVAKILWGWPTMWIVIPSYGLVLLLTIVSDERFVNIGWDSGGVTTGDITSPVLIALGLGVAGAVGAPDGFSLIAMGSVWPIISVLSVGILITRTTPFLQEQRERAERRSAAPPAADAG
jgi:hypothetical protein